MLLLKCNGDNFYVKTDDDFKHGYWWVFEGDTLVKIGGEYKKMSEIVENDLSDDNIFGGTQITDDEIKIFDYNGIKVSGNTLYYNQEHEFGKEYFKEMPKLWKTIVEGKIFYNLITYDNIVNIIDRNGNVVKFRDFVENGDQELNDKIDELVKERLNVMNYD